MVQWNISDNLFLNVHSTVDLHVAIATFLRNIVVLQFFFNQEINVQGPVGDIKAFGVCLLTVMVMRCSVTANDDINNKHYTPFKSIRLSNLLNLRDRGDGWSPFFFFPHRLKTASHDGMSYCTTCSNSDTNAWHTPTDNPARRRVASSYNNAI